MKGPPLKVSVLIVDANATNRMALKVKLASALYNVVQAASGKDALAILRQQKLHIVIASDALSDMSLPDLAQTIARQGGEDAPPLIGMTPDPAQHLALLSAGAEDVLSRPVHEGHLIARVRSVLRSHAAAAEWRLRDSTSRALGFAEPVQMFNHATPTVLLTAQGIQAPDGFCAALKKESSLRFRTAQLPSALADLQAAGASDVVLFPLAPDALSTLADLRAHPALRSKAILAIAPYGAHDLAARALDLGADDVAMARAPSLFAAQEIASEIALRAHRLHARHQMTQSLRINVRNSAEAALRDPLTGLYNRRYALPYLDRIAEKADQTDRPFAVMVADLDHFKRINDTYGHAVGDAVLVECAARLQKNMRAMDLVARIGGEEFLIVMPATNRQNARQAALRLCERISGTPLKVPGLRAPLTMTISIGLALSTTQPDLFDMAPTDLLTHPAQMLERADRALYEAKQGGRNRFSLERPAA